MREIIQNICFADNRTKSARALVKLIRFLLFQHIKLFKLRKKIKTSIIQWKSTLSKKYLFDNLARFEERFNFIPSAHLRIFLWKLFTAASCGNISVYWNIATFLNISVFTTNLKCIIPKIRLNAKMHVVAQKICKIFSRINK